ncbi:MAG TPA: RDD family protein [Gaiellaceae bacterium]|nr:RDD family protein [Gaiellaceae bacterium]
MSERPKRIADSAGRAAFYPARVAARAWRGRIESAAEDVLSAPEIARIVDRALAGPLPEELARSLVRHRVIERVLHELAESGELERMIEESLRSRVTLDLTDRVLASDEMQRALESIASSPELRRAVRRQSAGLAEEVVGGVRKAAARLDDRVERAVRRAPRPERPIYAGVASRGAALAFDALAAIAIYATASAMFALIASLVGGIRPHWLAGSLLGAGWVLIVGGYFVLFWSAAGQTPGMRLMRLRVRRADRRGLSTLRAAVRAVGLALAIIPLFAGFVPALFDARRRALPDYLAGTVVVDEEAEPRAGPAGSPG